MLVAKEDISQLIPQRPPIVMVDGLKEHDAKLSVSSFHILPDNIFVAEGHFQMPGLIENIAQTVALRTGYEHTLRIASEMRASPQTPEEGIHTANPPIGFIGEVKNLVIHFLPPAGAVLETRVEQLHNILTASVVRGAALCNGKVAAECEMKVFAKV